MVVPIDAPLSLFANATAATDVMRAYVVPVVATLCTLAGLASTLFLTIGGIRYITSRGDPEKLGQAKKIVKNALIGLALVIAAATLTAILSGAYNATGNSTAEKLPALEAITPASTNNGLVDAIINTVIGFLQNIVQSVGEPFLNALGYFLNKTPLMGENSNVFNLWLAIVGITDVLFVLAIALIGFHVMSFSAFGFDEIDIKQLLPQLALIFLLINTSIFAIDSVISLSNAMIHAIQSAFVCTDIWLALGTIAKKSNDLGVAGLLIMVTLLVLTVMLLIYYIGRIITLYIGAVLSPLVMLLWLIPAFKDFAVAALKTYLTTIFVLFVHVVILILAASIFSGIAHGDNSDQPNALMAMLVGLATVVALLKTQGFMQELSYAASAPRAARELSGSFMRGVGYMSKTAMFPAKVVEGASKVNNSIRNFGKSNQQKGNGQAPASSPTIVRYTASGSSRKQKDSSMKTGETRRTTAKKEADKTGVKE